MNTYKPNLKSKYNRPTSVPAYRPVPMMSGGDAAGGALVSSANSLFNSTGVDYPVSGDETLRGHGFIGIRQRHINLWHSIELNNILSEV